MTPLDSKVRLGLYVACVMVSTASAGLIGTDFADPKQVAAYALGILGSGLITARSYIDKSPTEIQKPNP